MPQLFVFLIFLKTLKKKPDKIRLFYYLCTINIIFGLKSLAGRLNGIVKYVKHKEWRVHVKNTQQTERLLLCKTSCVRCTILLRLYWVVKALHSLARCTVHRSRTNRPQSDHNWYTRLQEAQEQHCDSFPPPLNGTEVWLDSFDILC